MYWYSSVLIFCKLIHRARWSEVRHLTIPLKNIIVRNYVVYCIPNIEIMVNISIQRHGDGRLERRALSQDILAIQGLLYRVFALWVVRKVRAQNLKLGLIENHFVLSPVFWLLDFNPRWQWGQYGCLRKVTPTSSSLRSCKRFTTTPGTWWTLGTSFSLILSRVQAIAWSPATSLVVAPKTLQFATSGTDHKLRLFRSDLNEVKVSETQKP